MAAANTRAFYDAATIRVRLKQRIRFPLFECLFHRISVLHGASRQGGGGGMLYVSGALRRTYTLFYPRPNNYPRKKFYSTGPWN